MDKNLLTELRSLIKGDIVTDDASLTVFSHDASLFEVKPQVIIYPKDKNDVMSVVSFVEKHKKDNPNLSITGRSAGTDMGGGPLTESIVLAFGKYFNHTPVIKNTIATTQPGVFYRDFEIETLKHNLIFPSYPASREICAMGGIVNNNSGGEKSLQYGKTEQYVKRVKVVLRDGKVHEFSSLTEAELEKKITEKNLEGEIYKKIYELIKKNYDLLMKAKPKVSKNSAGYYIWNVWDKEKKIFDLTKLWVGAQGTFGMLLEADIQLVPVHKHREMMVLFLHDLSHLQQIINAVMPLKPESFESYDDNTLKLALRYFPEFAQKLGAKNLIQTGFDFLPEFLMVLRGGLPKLILQIDFTGNDPEELKQKITLLKEKLAPLHPKTRIAIENEEQKYWLIRRESFNLLRQKIHDKHTAPFVDDFVIPPGCINDVIPKITKMFHKYPGFVYTVAGHVGDGNFHIIPLADIADPKIRAAIPVLEKEVYELVISYGGSITGEHNDGIIRTPYLEQMYGKKIIDIFREIKEIFDPEYIFNPGKKVGGTVAYAMEHIRQSW